MILLGYSKCSWLRKLFDHAAFFMQSESGLRGHPYKLYKPYCRLDIGNFFLFSLHYLYVELITWLYVSLSHGSNISTAFRPMYTLQGVLISNRLLSVLCVKLN